MPVTIYYFPNIRGRAEVVKLLCAAKGIEFKCIDVAYEDMKANRERYPFGQSPAFEDGEVSIVQSNAFVRHLARKHGLYGRGEVEMAGVDVLLDAVESMRLKYLTLIYTDKLSPEASEAYWATHGDTAGAAGRNGGVHFTYFDALLAQAGGAHFVGEQLTAADLAVWEILDLHLRIFKERLAAQYPALAAFHGRIAALPGIKEYLEGPQRIERPNNNSLG